MIGSNVIASGTILMHLVSLISSGLRVISSGYVVTQTVSLIECPSIDITSALTETHFVS